MKINVIKFNVCIFLLIPKFRLKTIQLLFSVMAFIVPPIIDICFLFYKCQVVPFSSLTKYFKRQDFSSNSMISSINWYDYACLPISKVVFRIKSHSICQSALKTTKFVSNVREQCCYHNFGSDYSTNSQPLKISVILPCIWVLYI